MGKTNTTYAAKKRLYQQRSYINLEEQTERERCLDAVKARVIAEKKVQGRLHRIVLKRGYSTITIETTTPDKYHSAIKQGLI